MGEGPPGEPCISRKRVLGGICTAPVSNSDCPGGGRVGGSCAPPSGVDVCRISAIKEFGAEEVALP